MSCQEFQSLSASCDFLVHWLLKGGVSRRYSGRETQNLLHYLWFLVSTEFLLVLSYPESLLPLTLTLNVSLFVAVSTSVILIKKCGV